MCIMGKDLGFVHSTKKGEILKAEEHLKANE